jgi:hypothetical protein
MTAEPSNSEDGIVQQLTQHGYSPIDAELLPLLLQLACGRVVIATLPNRPRVMPETVIFPDDDGRDILVPLAAIPEYVAALDMAQSVYEAGGPARDRVLQVGCCGSELRAFQAAYEAGQDLTRSQVGSPMFMDIANVAGFEEWYQGLQINGQRLPPLPRGNAGQRVKRWWQFWK